MTGAEEKQALAVLVQVMQVRQAGAGPAEELRAYALAVTGKLTPVGAVIDSANRASAAKGS